MRALIVLLMLPLGMFAQDTTKAQPDKIYVINEVSKSATIKGYKNFKAFLYKHNTRQSPEAVKANYSSEVSVSFVIDTSGNTRIKYPGIVGTDSSSVQEARRLIHLSSGKWQPAVKNGKKVSMLWRTIWIMDRFEGAAKTSIVNAILDEDQVFGKQAMSYQLLIEMGQAKIKKNEFADFLVSDEIEDDTPEEELVDDNHIYEMYNIQEPASFPGGDEALFKFIVENVKYPKMALDSGISGTVVLQFIVNKKGEVEKIEILSEPFGYGIEKAAKNVVNLTSGMWIPAKQRDKLVNMRFRIPIRFTNF